MTTTYQISENIIVLYRGRVAVVGDVEKVVKDPKHPYTQLLVGSIPLPDPDHTWHKEQLPTDFSASAARPSQGCRFGDRCPFVMRMCREKVPPLYQADRYRAASCFLLREAPELEARKMGDVFVGVAAGS